MLVPDLRRTPTGAPYATIYQVSERQPVTDRELKGLGLNKHSLRGLAPSLRPDRELLRELIELCGAKFLSPLVRCLVAAAPAKSVVVEHNYYDLDFRSEYSLAYATRYGAAGPPRSMRLHFFKRQVSFDSILRGKTKQLQDAYLGYVVLRPFGRGSVGRTLLAPPRRMTGVIDCSFADRIRTVVSEDIQLFGRSLTASGVPFLEQDGHLLRCAHTVAWQTHYSAVLRGLVPRRPTAAFFTAGLDSPAAGTRYPSVGLTAQSIVDVLTKFDLSPEIVDLKELESSLEVDFFHRSSVMEQKTEKWWRSNVTAAVCRYLNSGTPVGLAFTDHAVTICGYVRRRNVGDNMSMCMYDGTETEFALWRDCCKQSYDEDDVVAFIVHDDQVGPYVFVAVEHILELAEKKPGMIIIPRPHSQWLSGSDAEKVGCRLFKELLLDAVEEPQRYFSDDSEDGSGELPSSTLEQFLDDLKSLKKLLYGRGLAVRSYVLPATDFKLSYLQRCYCNQARPVVSLIRLPKHVWVVEIFVRSRRLEGDGVIAQVVLDASGPTEREARALILQVPNLIVAREPEWGDAMIKQVCTVGLMMTGRWAHTRPQATVASRAKAAIPEESLNTLF